MPVMEGTLARGECVRGALRVAWAAVKAVTEGFSWEVQNLFFVSFPGKHTEGIVMKTVPVIGTIEVSFSSLNFIAQINSS